MTAGDTQCNVLPTTMSHSHPKPLTRERGAAGGRGGVESSEQQSSSSRVERTSDGLKGEGDETKGTSKSEIAGGEAAWAAPSAVERLVWELKEAFAVVDDDDNGFVATRKLAEVMRRCPMIAPRRGDAPVEQVAKLVDMDGHGVFELDDLVRVMVDLNTRPATPAEAEPGAATATEPVAGARKHQPAVGGYPEVPPLQDPDAAVDRDEVEELIRCYSAAAGDEPSREELVEMLRELEWRDDGTTTLRSLLAAVQNWQGELGPLPDVA